MRDVVIAGAGPAGSAAAAALSARGYDVLIADRAAFPRDKTCGDGIPPGTVALLHELGMEARLAAAGFHAIHAIRLVSPGGRSWEARFDVRRAGAQFLIAPRIRFDELMKDHAVSCGASFERARVTDVVRENGRVAGVRLRTGGGVRVERARVVIGADGATSAVARSVGFRRPPPDRRFVATRGYAEGLHLESGRVEFWFHRRLLPGYGWVFPLGGGRANIGVMARADRVGGSRGTLADRLRAFCDMLNRERGLSVEVTDPSSWQLPLSVSPRSRRVFDGALLAGDAGALIDPATGEGIHFAVASGILAAEAVDASLRGGGGPSALERYDARCEQEFGPLIRRSYRFHRWFACRPGLFEALFVAANAAPGVVRRVLNRHSTDFRILA